MGLGSILDQMVTARPWEAGMALGVLARRWSEVVGDRLSKECEPVGLEAGTLTVRASTHAWAAQIRFLAGQVRDRSGEVVGAGRVGSIRVVVGPI